MFTSMNNWVSIPYWLLMLALVRMSYEMSVERSSPVEQSVTAVSNTPQADLLPQQREWSEKAVKRYAQAQEKKWQRWCDTMFRPKS